MGEICFLSMDDLGWYVADDDLAIGPLSELGVDVSTLSWRQTKRQWSEFQSVIIRTPWDYQSSPDEFLSVLSEIEGQTRLENPLDIVRWNLAKTYLRDMEERGVRIVPSIWRPKYSEEQFGFWRDVFGQEELIIKPVVSATAEHTYRLGAYDSSLESIFKTRPFLVQPFIPNIVDEGEFSLFYFNGRYSHAINKSPKANDFRVQEEHGGIITAIQPDDELLRAGEEVVREIEHDLLYARVDFVRDEHGKLCLMELELIEPALYLRMDAGAPKRFARAINERLTANKG
ncbi:MAG: RimK family alpha-L-glutamate ligase [Pyrinomonadaceae bacterium]